MPEAEKGRVLVAGGTGLVGHRLVEALLAQGLEVQVVSRRPDSARIPPGATLRSWNELPTLLEGSLAVINLAGEGIAERRWSPQRKQLLKASRLGPTTALVDALQRTRRRPTVLINASATGIYGSLGEVRATESQPPGKGFLADLCRAWEAALDPLQALGLRVVKLRIGVVLAREGGALPKLAQPVRLFAGSALGSGKQGFSWIHLEDLVSLILECLRNPAFEGPVNATAPHPCSNAAFTRLLAKRLHRPVWPLPAFLSRAALKLLVGEMAEPMLLGGAFVLPQKALDLGFRFRYPEPTAALEDLL